MSMIFNLERYQQAVNLGKQLQKAFPNCFFPAGQEKPLKVGIFQDLVAKCNELSPRPDKTLICFFMCLYTSALSYRAALITPNAVRIDLNGKECEPVTAKARYRAKIMTKKIGWALENHGYEAEQLKQKVASKALSKKLPETLKQELKEPVKKQAEPVASKARSLQDKPAIKTTITQAAGSRRKPVTVIIKKHRVVLPESG